MDKFWENYITTRPADSKGAFDAFKQMHQDPRPMAQGPRNMYAGGQLVSQLVTPNPDGSRPGYAPKKGWKKEKEKFFKWLADNPDYDFANSSAPEIIKKSGTKFEVGTIQKFLNEKGIQTKHSIARGQETPKYTKKVLAELRKDLPAGISVEQGRPGKYYFRIMLKGGKAGKETYRNSMVANEANKKLIIEDFNRVSKEYYPGRLTDQEFKDLRLKHKDMTTKQFAKFLEGEGKTTYLGDKWNASSVSRLQSKLDIGVGTTGPLTIRTVDEAKKIIRQHPGAKFFFLGNPTDSEITQYASDLVSREKLSGKGGKKGFPIGGTKEGKMFRNFYDSSLKADGRMELLTDVPTDADGNIDWKMKDKNGVHVWKKAKFYDNKTGATYTWGKNYKPGDLRRQVDAAYGDGFFAKSVKTYDDQAKMNKMKFKGRSLNEWMREGLLQKELEVKLDRPLTNSKADKKLLKEFYALRKPSFSFTEAHHVEGVGKNPFRMEVSYRAANREQNNLLNKYKAGNLTKTEYAKAMENLSDTKGGIRYKTDGRFIGQTGTPERIIATSAKDAGLLKNKDFVKFLKQSGFNINKCLSSGGRVGFAEAGLAGVNTCIRGVIEEEQAKAQKGNKISLKKFNKFGKLARTGAWFLGPIDIPLELGFALPHMLSGDKEAAKRATTAGLFGWGKSKMDEIKAGSAEGYKYAKHMKDNNDWMDAWFSQQDAVKNLSYLADLPEHAQKEKKFIYSDQKLKAEEKMDSIFKDYKGYDDPFAEAKGKSAFKDYLRKDVKEKTDVGMPIRLEPFSSTPYNWAPFKGGQPITNLKQYIAQKGEPYWKQLEHAAYEAGVPELFDQYFTTADVKDVRDAYSDLPIKYASQLAKLEKEEMLRGLKAKGMHGTVGFKKMLEAQDIDPQEVWDVGKKDWEFDILGKRRFRASGGRAGYMGGGIAAIRKPHAIPPTGGPQSGGLPSLYNNVRKW